MSTDYERCCERHFHIRRSRQPGAQKTVNIWHGLTQHVGGHPQQCVQQIVDLSVPLHDVGKLLVVHKLHVGPRVRGHMLSNKVKVNERVRNAWGGVYKKTSYCWRRVMMVPVLTLSSRKLRYSLPNEPSGIDAISFRSSVARRILGLSLSITSHGKPMLDQKKPEGQSWEGT